MASVTAITFAIGFLDSAFIDYISNEFCMGEWAVYAFK